MRKHFVTTRERCVEALRRNQPMPKQQPEERSPHSITAWALEQAAAYEGGLPRKIWRRPKPQR